MTRKRQDRIARLMSGGIPRHVRCYDDGGKSVDRYTVVFTGRWPGKTRGRHPYLAMSGAPFHPQGFGQHGETHGRPCDIVGNRWGGPSIGRRCHLGLRIPFEALPKDCQTLVLGEYKHYWDLA